MNYDAMVDKFYEEFEKKEVDWSAVTRLVASLGDEINAVFNKDETFLSQVYHCVSNGEDGMKLTKIFLENGYDVKANDGYNGAACLKELCWCFYDNWILRIAESIIDLGVDCGRSYEDTDYNVGSVLDTVDWKSGNWMTGSYDCANLFEAYYTMVERASNGKAYKGIRGFDEAKGKTVTKVERIIPNREIVDEYDMGEGIILWCDQVPVVISRYIDAVIDPHICEDTEREDVSDKYKDIIGLTIKNLFFKTQSSARLYFKERKYLFLLNVYLRDPDEPRIARCMIKDTANTFPWSKGDPIKAIKFDSGTTYAKRVTGIDPGQIFMEKGDCLYHITGVNTVGRDTGELCIDEIPLSWGEKLTRSLDEQAMCIDELSRTDRNIKWICIKSKDSYIYITPESFNGVGIFCTHERIQNDDQDVRYKEIRFTDKKGFNSLRLLMYDHKYWNHIEIWPSGKKIAYRIGWRDKPNKNPQDDAEPHIEDSVYAETQMTLDYFMNKLRDMKFDDWFEDDNCRASMDEEVVWWLFYDDGTGWLKERDHLDHPKITQKQMDDFVSLLEEVVAS